MLPLIGRRKLNEMKCTLPCNIQYTKSNYWTHKDKRMNCLRTKERPTRQESKTPPHILTITRKKARKVLEEIKSAKQWSSKPAKQRDMMILTVPLNREKLRDTVNLSHTRWRYPRTTHQCPTGRLIQQTCIAKGCMQKEQNCICFLKFSDV